jgi:hypothetical protein
MKITGKLIKKLPLEKGVSKTGNEWKKQSILLEQNSEYNKEVVISFFGDKIDKLKNVELGNDLTILVNISSREYNGKYYHNIDGYWVADAVEEKVEDNNMPF